MEKIISREIKELFGVDTEVTLSRPDPQFGDFACNAALQLSKALGKNPRVIAEELAGKLRENEQFSEVAVAGPGFINLRLSSGALAKEVEKIIEHPDNYGKSDLYKGKTVVTEYSDPNPFKVLHIGHFYTSVVGDAVSKLIEFAGGKVHRVNFGGDVGLHAAKTLWAIVQELDGENPAKLSTIDKSERSDWMAKCYVQGTQAYDEDSSANAEIIAINRQIYEFHSQDDQDSPLAQIYWTCRQWSYDYFDEFYKRIGTSFDKYYPESQTAPVGLKTVLEQKDKGVYKESDGAIVFVGEPYGLHTRVFVNSGGLPTYEAKDVGLSIKKWEDYHFDESIIITGNDIIEYMKVVVKSIEQFKPELAERTKHFTHGNVKLAGGVKMSSRKGNFLKAVDILDAVAEANEVAQGSQDEAPVLGAIKYAFLKHRVGPDIVFSPEDSVSIQGNSGPYLQYSYVRAQSVLRKLDKNKDFYDGLFDDLDDNERTLAVKMIEYPEVVAQATKELAPHQLCTYLYELAQAFSRFYENAQIAGDSREAVRGQLASGYSAILKSGLTVLGIPAPDKL